MDVYSAILLKRAVRDFQEHPLPEDAVHKILNAGRRAQSAKNMQPWHFIAVKDRQRLISLSKCGHFAGHIAGAAMAVAIITLPPEQRFSILFDAGQSAAYMQLAAWELGIGSCLATIYEPERAREILGFPEEFAINIAISFGYPREESVITKPPQTGGRMPASEIFHFETW